MLNTSDFKPAWWLPDAHSQTLWPYLFHRAPSLQPEWERLELPDGDFVDLCRTGNPNGPVVALFHGLEGGIGSPYAARMLAAVAKRQWCGVLMHFRGCSGTPNRRQRSYHSGDTGDIAYLLDILARRHPDVPRFAIGYSLGGNALLKYLGERGAGAPLDAAAAVSVPFLLANGAARLQRGLSRIYQQHLVGLLRHKVMHKVDTGLLDYRPETIARLKTFYEFDQHVTAPLHGFAGADDYYARSSSRQYLQNIGIPTLIVHARDDPFMTPAAIPAAGELSPRVRLELSERGGHVGFIGGAVPGRPEYWLERRIPEFLAEYCSGFGTRDS